MHGLPEPNLPYIPTCHVLLDKETSNLDMFYFQIGDSGPGRTRANFVYFQFLDRKKLAKISQGPNFGGGRIGPTCLSQNLAN